jgi:hypothetical protein
MHQLERAHDTASYSRRGVLRRIVASELGDSWARLERHSLRATRAPTAKHVERDTQETAPR